MDERLKTATSGAYLLVGPSGVGKSTAALRLAAGILCPKSCGTCEICRRIYAGLHPDVQMFEPEGYTYPVEVIREIVVSAARSPIEARSQVFIIDEAHLIAERSQNALLKALEEPNASVTFVLVGAALSPFLPTVLSRCQIIEFAPMTDETLLALLPGPDPSLIVRFARGDGRRAMSLAENETEQDLRRLALDAAVEPEPSIHRAFVIVEKLGEVVARIRSATENAQSGEIETFDETVGAGRGTVAPRRKVLDRHKRALRRAESEAHISFLGWLGDAFRDLALASSGPTADALIASDRASDLIQAASAKPTAEWLHLVEATVDACTAIRENANATMAVESVLLRLQSKQSAGVAQMAERRIRNA